LLSLLAFSLVLAAAFCHATWNFYVKKINGGPELVWLFSLVACVLYLPAAIYIFIQEAPSFGWIELVFIVGSSVLHIGYFLLLQAGYRNGDLSLVYPTARATGPVLSVSFAVLFLGELITLQVALGAALIIFGVVSLTGGFSKRASNLKSSLAFGLGSGTFIGAYTVWDAHAVATIMIPPLLLDYASIFIRMIIMTPVAIKRADQVKMHWRDHRLPVFVVAALSPLAYILVLYAMTFTPVVYIAPLRESSVLLTVLMGSIILGEGDLKRRLGWAVIIMGGVAILATG
tara:strand:+ start:17434 stop:18294 length:861 start_codon:yes stop_codon:yes gene_type:complete